MASLAHGWIMNLEKVSTMGNHNSQARLRMSPIEAVFFVVVEVKYGSSTRPLFPGHVRQVSVVDTVSALQNDLVGHS